MRKGMQRLAMVVLALQALHATAHSVGSQNTSQQQANLITQAAKRNPADLHAVVAAGEFYFRHERWPESVEWLSRAYALSRQDAKIGYDLAFARIQANELDAAQKQLLQMSARDNSARVHSLLAEVEESRGNAARAVQQYYQAAQIDPSESNIFDLANCLLQHKKYVGYLPEAVKYFRYGASRFPKSSKLMVGLGVALYASQEYDEAVKVLCAAVDLDPSDQRPVTFLGMARKISPDLAAQVNQRLKAFAEQYPQNPAANYEYAMSLWDRGAGEQGQGMAEIESLLQRASKEAPRWYEPHYQLAVAYEGEKRYLDAIREMRKATELEPAFKPAHFQLAQLYKRIGDNARAAQESARAKALNDAQIKSEMLQHPRN